MDSKAWEIQTSKVLILLITFCLIPKSQWTLKVSCLQCQISKSLVFFFEKCIQMGKPTLMFNIIFLKFQSGEYFWNVNKICASFYKFFFGHPSFIERSCCTLSLYVQAEKRVSICWDWCWLRSWRFTNTQLISI